MLMNLADFLEMAKAQTSTPIKNGGPLNPLDQSSLLNRSVLPFKPIDSRAVSPQSGQNLNDHTNENKPSENGHVTDHDMNISSAQIISNHLDLVRETRSPTGSRKRKLVPGEIPTKNQSLKQCLLETLADVIPYHRNLSLRLLMTYTIDNNQSECILIDEILNKSQSDKFDLIQMNPTSKSQLVSCSSTSSSLSTSSSSSILNSVLFKKEELLLKSADSSGIQLVKQLNQPLDGHALDLSVRLESPESMKRDPEEPNSKTTDSERPNSNPNEEKIGKLCSLYDSLRVTSSSMNNQTDRSDAYSATYSVPISLLSASTTTPSSGTAIITTTTVNNNRSSNGSTTMDKGTNHDAVSTNGPNLTNSPVQPANADDANGEPLKNDFPLIDASSILTLLPLLQQHQNQSVSNLLNPSMNNNTTTTTSTTSASNGSMVTSGPGAMNMSPATMMNNPNTTISNAASILLSQLCGSPIETNPISLAGLAPNNQTLIKSLEQQALLNNSNGNNIHNGASNTIIQPAGLNNSSIIGFPLFNPFMTTDQLNAVQTLLPTGPLLGTTLAAPNFTSFNLGSATLLNLKDKNTGIETVSIMPSTKSLNQHPVASLINPISVRTFSQLLNQTNASLSSSAPNSSATISLSNSNLFSNCLPTDEEPILNGQVGTLVSNELNRLAALDKDPASLSSPLLVSTNPGSLNSMITSLSASSSPSSSTTNHISLGSADNLKLNMAIANSTTSTGNSNGVNNNSTSNGSNNNNHFLFGRRLTHSRRFTCNQCRRNFASLADLNRHTLETHNSFRCTICSAHFTQRSNLQRHSLKHVGFKPFTCNLCKKEYYRKDHLVRHIEVTHPNHDPKMNITVHLTSSECLDYLDRLNTGKSTTPPALSQPASTTTLPPLNEDNDPNCESVDPELEIFQEADDEFMEPADGSQEEGDQTVQN